jgi:stringent starvation protein B
LGGVARQLAVPFGKVYALYARETGQGMTFDIDGPKAGLQSKAEAEPRLPAVKPPTQLPVPATTPDPPKKPSGGKPTLRRIK